MDVNIPSKTHTKHLILSPQNGADFYYHDMKIRTDNDKSTKFFCYASTKCTIKNYKLVSTYKDVLCKCCNPMNREIKLIKIDQSEENRGVIINRPWVLP